MSGQSVSCRLGLLWEKKDLRGGATSHANVHPSALQMTLLLAAAQRLFVHIHPRRSLLSVGEKLIFNGGDCMRGMNARNSALQRTIAAESHCKAAAEAAFLGILLHKSHISYF